MFFLRLFVPVFVTACAVGGSREASPTVPVASAAATAPEPPSSDRFRCTEVIGLTITAEWYGAGFEQLVDDARFQARVRPHTFVDQWADPDHEAWKEPPRSPCAEQSSRPDRVVLFAANWKLESEEQWLKVLRAVVATVKKRYPQLRALELYTVARGPNNTSCGDPKSVVAPMVDSAMTRVAAEEPQLVGAGPKVEVPDCSVFEKGGPHFTQSGRRLIARQMALHLR